MKNILNGYFLSASEKYDLDYIIEPEQNNKDVFATVKPLLLSVIEGYNTCIIAYGASGMITVTHYELKNIFSLVHKNKTDKMLHFYVGSGKSHTMFGNDADLGLVPRSIDYLLQCMPGYYRFKANFFEIYNENFTDLLKDEGHITSKSIAIYKTTLKTGASVEKVANLESIEIVSAEQFIETMKKVHVRRKSCATARNAGSSRSHAIIQIEVEGKYANIRGEKIESSIMFLDLAGCENGNDHLDDTGRGTAQNEMTNINKSVSSFQTVIQSLKNKEPATDFRSSKLTYLLKPCLTTNTKTLLITTISQEKKYLYTSKASLAVTRTAGQLKIKDLKRNLIKMQ